MTIRAKNGLLSMHLSTLVVFVLEVGTRGVATSTVASPPHIQLHSGREQVFAPGEVVKLQCEASGSPPPTYTWQKNGIPFQPEDVEDVEVEQLPGTGTVTFRGRGVDERLEGLYQCFADNVYGTSVGIQTNLRMARLPTVDHKPDLTVTPEVGSALTLPCRVSPSVPEGLVIWVLMNQYGSLTPLDYSPRINVDPLRNDLHFSNVELSDHQEGSGYTCMAFNSALRRTVFSGQTFISPRGEVAEQHPAEMVWSSPRDVVWVLGSTGTLMCIFSGNPTPEVWWGVEREGAAAPLPDRAHPQTGGQELLVRDVREEDAGVYSCWANSSASASITSTAFNVVVQSAPYWVEVPMHTDALTGVTADVNCVAAGNPPPTVSWFVNGVPLSSLVEQDDRFRGNRYSFDGDHLILRNLTLADRMVVQCNATNVHGYLWADVALNVFNDTLPNAG